MKLLVVASSLDLDLPYGCTGAWWQLLKGLNEEGVELIAAPYAGRPVASLWWRSSPNPCEGIGNLFARFKRMASYLPKFGKRKTTGASKESFGQRFQRSLVRWIVTPRWRKHLSRTIEREDGVDGVLLLTPPLNHFVGVASYLREKYRVPVVFFDGDMPASLPSFGGFASGFNIYHGADLSEYDGVLSNSQGSLEHLDKLGARRTGVLWWGADPDLFRPVRGPEDVDVFFYGFGTEFRKDWIERMITVPSNKLPGVRFVVAGGNLDVDLGRAERIGLLAPASLAYQASRARINLNIARDAHSSVYASATTRLFELASMEATIVSNPLLGLEEWFSPGKELEVVTSAEEAIAAYQRLLADHERRKQLATAARLRLLQAHTYRHRAQALIRFFHSIPGK